MKYEKYLDLIRIKNPTGFLLLFFPCVIGVAMSATNPSHLKILPLLFFGSIFMRASGCIINDLCDQDLDAKVQRTALRPLANGDVSNIEAIIILILCLLCGLYVFVELSNFGKSIALFGAILMVIYPWCKRITYWPQLFLGITFNIGIILTSIECVGVSSAVLIMYIATIFWTIAYDTVYGFADIEDDLKIGVKSFSILLYRKYDADYEKILTVISFFYALFLGLYLLSITLAGMASLESIVIYFIGCLMTYQQLQNLDLRDPKSCIDHFRYNQNIGFILVGGLLIIKIWNIFL